MDGFAEELGAKLDGYERILSKQAYLAGDEITLADLFVSNIYDTSHGTAGEVVISN